MACIGSTVVALLAGGAVVEHRATTSWAAMETHGATMRADFDRRDHRRDALWGDNTDGAAFAEYARAAALAKPLSGQDHLELVATLRRTDAEIAAETVELRARWRPALEAMRAGAHRRDVRPPAVCGEDPNAGVSNLLLARWITNVAMFEARALRQAGQHREAVEWTLDAMTFGADHVRNGVLINQMIGLALVAIATSETWSDAALHRLDRPALDLLAAGLARLDAQLPWHLDLTADLLWLADSLAHPPGEGYGVGSATAWRYGFSAKWMTADAFAHYAATMERLADSRQLAWSKHQASMNAEMTALANSSNPMLSLMAPNVTAAESNLRQTLARIRLLRAAVGLLRGDDISRLRDPLGDGMLKVTREGDLTYVRSVGVPNGRSFERCVERR